MSCLEWHAHSELNNETNQDGSGTGSFVTKVDCSAHCSCSVLSVKSVFFFKFGLCSLMRKNHQGMVSKALPLWRRSMSSQFFQHTTGRQQNLSRLVCLCVYMFVTSESEDESVSEDKDEDEDEEVEGRGKGCE